MYKKSPKIYEKEVDNSLLEAVQKMHGDVKHHVLVVVCCMLAGVVLMVAVLVWKMFSLTRKMFRQPQVVYRVDDIGKSNTVGNVYESVNINKDENPFV